MTNYPSWATEMAEIFKGGSISQFLLYGNVSDWIVFKKESEQKHSTLSIKDFLCQIMLSPFEVVITYDRGNGIKIPKGSDIFFEYINKYTPLSKAQGSANNQSPSLPKDPKSSLTLLDQFIRFGLNRIKANNTGQKFLDAIRIAVVIDYVQYLLPRAEVAYTSSESVDTLIRILDWASDPNINSAYIATCLIAENLNDLNTKIVENPRTAKICIGLPNSLQMQSFVDLLTEDVEDFSSFSEFDKKSLSQKLEGLSCVDVQNLIVRARKNNKRIVMDYLRDVKKEMIEKSAGDKIVFVESTRTLDDVAGHSEAKQWLRQDAQLMKAGKLKALPMGYLINGRIGTGKTFLVECFAGEVGVPCVELKNFRDKWVGATESNLEAIFKILHAMGQVIVFIDEADQVAGKRESAGGDSGVSGRIYAMLAREMANTANRGKIFWIFATSRPDLLEVDLKRVGRLDVHIPLFPPQTNEDKTALFMSLAKKNKIKLKESDIPDFPKAFDLTGNEMEGILIIASRMFELQAINKDSAQNNIGFFIKKALESFRPMAHSARLEYMDLAAIVECSDKNFLPAKYAKMDVEEAKQRMEELKRDFIF